MVVILSVAKDLPLKTISSCILATCAALLSLFVVRQAEAGTCDTVTADTANEVHEASFSYLFQHNESGQQDKASFYVLRVKSGFPLAANVIRRLSEQAPAILPESATDASAGQGLVEKGTSRTGLLFSIDSINWTDCTHAEVTGGYWESGESASKVRLYVEKGRGGWVVEHAILEGIS